MRTLTLSLALLAVLGCAYEDRAANSAHASRLLDACYQPMRAKACAKPTADERESCIARLAASLDLLDDASARRDLAVRAGCPERLAEAVR